MGAAASRMQAIAKQTLGAATRAVSPKVTERARTLTEKHRHSDRIALTKSLPIAVCRLCRAGLALSGASRQLSQRESLEAAPKHKISNSRIKMLDSLPGVW